MSYIKGTHGTLLRGLEGRHYCGHFIEKSNNAQKPRRLYKVSEEARDKGSSCEIGAIML